MSEFKLNGYAIAANPGWGLPKDIIRGNIYKIWGVNDRTLEIFQPKSGKNLLYNKAFFKPFTPKIGQKFKWTGPTGGRLVSGCIYTISEVHENGKIGWLDVVPYLQTGLQDFTFVKDVPELEPGDFVRVVIEGEVYTIPPDFENVAIKKADDTIVWHSIDDVLLIEKRQNPPEPGKAARHKTNGELFHVVAIDNGTAFVRHDGSFITHHVYAASDLYLA